MNGYDTRFKTYTTEVGDYTQIKIISQVVNRNGKNYLVGPVGGDFVPSLLPNADYFGSHKTAAFEVQLVDDFGNQYINNM